MTSPQDPDAEKIAPLIALFDELYDEMRIRIGQMIASIHPSPGDVPLFHYCTTDTAIKVLESGTMWASDLLFLNDARELRDGLGVIRDAVDRLSPERTEFSATFKRLVDDAVRELDDSLTKGTTRIFGVSFSGHADDVSQWRAYSLHGRGMAIGIRLRDLRNLAESGAGAPDSEVALAFVPCLYTDEDKRQFVERMLPTFEDMLFACVKTHYGEKHTLTPVQAYALESTLLITIAVILPAFKHVSFASEREYRIVYSELALEGEQPVWKFPFHVRAGIHNLIPYVTIPLQTPEGFIPVANLMVGPSSNQGLATRAAADLKHISQCPIETIGESKIPLRLV